MKGKENSPSDGAFSVEYQKAIWTGARIQGCRKLQTSDLGRMKRR